VANSAEWKVVPLAASVDQRYADPSVDGLLTNGYLEKDEAGAIWTRRRAGLTKNTDLSNTSAGAGQAIYSSSNQGFGDFVSFRNGVYRNGLLGYSWVLVSNDSWFDQSTVVGSTQVYVSNGNEAAYYNGASFTKIVSPNYPNGTINGSAFLNGYLYVMDRVGSIWGSTNQNDFSTWSATNVVNAWGTVGQPYAIRRHLNEVLSFKTYTVEVFYDAGNNGIGSPLLPVQQINIKWGCIAPKTIVTIDDDIFWVGSSTSGLNSVIKMNQFNPVVVSNPQIDRLLSVNGAAFAPGRFQLAAYSCAMGGAKFYCLTYVYVLNGIRSTFLLSYNIKSGEWSVFKTGLIPDVPLASAQIYPIASSNNPFSDSTRVLFNDGNVYVSDDSTTVDTGTSQTPISMRLRTDNFEAGTSLRKMVSGLRIKADQKSASALRIRWSDDDYQTWSSWRNIDLTKSVPSLPGLQGTFSKRAYELEYAGIDPIRFSRLELLIALGDI